LDEAPLFDAVVCRIVSVLETLRPEGPFDPDYLSSRFGRRAPEQVEMLRLMREIEAIDPAAELGRTSDRDRQLLKLRGRLHGLIERVQQVEGETGGLKRD
jgi:hypothetical protein